MRTKGIGNPQPSCLRQMERNIPMSAKSLSAILLSCLVVLIVLPDLSLGRECIWAERFEQEELVGGELSGALTDDGKVGKGFLSRKAGDFAKFDTRGRFNLNEGTIDLWVKPNWKGGEKVERTIFDLTGSHPHWNRFYIGIHHQTGNLQFAIIGPQRPMEEGGTPYRHVSADIMNWKKGQWHRITATWKNINSGKRDGSFRLYVDGKPTQEARGEVKISELAKEMFVGSHASQGGGTRPFEGVIDEVSIHDYAMTAEEIASGKVSKTPRVFVPWDASAPKDSAPGSADENRLPIMTVVKAKIPPVIDGELKQDEWKHAASATGFVELLSGHLSDRPVTVYVTYDNDKLYMAFRSVVHGRPKAEEKQRDNSDVCNDDAIEILLQPAARGDRKRHIYHFIGNSIGTVFDTRDDPNARSASAWNGSWSFKNKVVDKGETVAGILTFAKSVWTAELAIPFKDLGAAAPKDGEYWRANFCRDLNRKTVQDRNRRFTSWSLPFAGRFARPEGFGYLYFRSSAPVIQVQSVGQLFTEGNIEIKSTASNPGPGTYNLYGEILMVDTKAKKEILRRKVPVVLKGAGQKRLDIRETVELSSAVPIRFDFVVGDYIDGRPLYRRTFNFVSSPSFTINSTLVYSKKIVELTCTARHLSGLSSSAKAVAEVYSAKDNKLVRSLPFEGFGKTHPAGTAIFDISNVAPGEYSVKAYVKDGDEIAATGHLRFAVPKKPVWWGNKLGISDKVPPPWSPVKVSGNTVSVLGREYHFANQAFPEKIITKGQPILTAPIRLDVVTDKGTVKWAKSELKRISQTDTKVTLGVTNTSPSVNLTAKVEVEFDGFMRVDFTLSPNGPVVIKNLVLKVPLRKEIAMYMKAENLGDWTDEAFGWYAVCLYEGAEGRNGDTTLTVNRKWHFSAKGWLWPEKFVHHVWVGDDDRGISVAFDSDRNWQTRKYVELADLPGTKEIRFNFIGSDCPLTEPLDYSLALLPTPAKPLPDDPKKWRYVWSGAQDPKGHEHLSIACQYGLTPGAGWPEFTAKGRELVRKFNEAGCKLTPDYYTNVTTKDMPEFQTFEKEWRTMPVHSWGQKAGTAIMVCMKGSYADFFLWGLNHLMDEGLRGIYFDSAGVLACKNRYAGCGYVAKDGTVQPTINLFEVREAYKRIYTLFKTRVPDSFIFVHPGPIAPLASFVDAVTAGEEWTDFDKPDLTYLSPDFLRCGYMMYQSYGVPFALYPGLPRGYPKQIKRDDLVPLTLSCNTWSICVGDRVQKAVWKIMEKWYRSSQCIPYWKNGHMVKSFSKDVKVSVYRKPDKTSLLIVANLANDGKKGNIEINLASFGLTDKNYKLTSLGLFDSSETNKSLVGSRLAVSLPAHSLKFYVLKKQ